MHTMYLQVFENGPSAQVSIVVCPSAPPPIARGRLPWQTWQAKQVSEHSNFIELVCHAMRCMICMH